MHVSRAFVVCWYLRVSGIFFFFFFSSRRRHTRCGRDWSSDVCSSDLMFISIVGAMATGFVGIAYVAKTQMELADAETIFIIFSQFLFHPLITGILLAAILAAIMSTISSQLLVTSSSLTEDLYKAFLRRNASDRSEERR